MVVVVGEEEELGGKIRAEGGYVVVEVQKISSFEKVLSTRTAPGLPVIDKYGRKAGFAEGRHITEKDLKENGARGETYPKRRRVPRSESPLLTWNF